MMLRGSGLKGLGAPPGYQIVGLCNPAANPLDPAVQERIMFPDGTTQCFAANDPNNPFYVAPTSGTPGYSPTVLLPPSNAPISSPASPSSAPAPALPSMPTNPILAGATAAAAQAASNDIMLGTFDVSQFVANDWMWLAGGAGLLIVLMTMGK